MVPSTANRCVSCVHDHHGVELRKDSLHEVVMLRKGNCLSLLLVIRPLSGIPIYCQPAYLSPDSCDGDHVTWVFSGKDRRASWNVLLYYPAKNLAEGTDRDTPILKSIFGI